ncbi:sugar ABC transporter substrate-binding protein [Actinoplanes sp. N902-109]|uniref:sugar ABC transporter substrate-binding protein n=1 Tax=Actinoplanes sp. (strain N902-109) TaxID=649831 RepID=UPI00032937BF|nr:substrate-binding domain-containing protein [Actinoplanes sp. N902-109]AGL17157.1 LacI family transcriptional regulator [Actinoplanes sp. N902-109]
MRPLALVAAVLLAAGALAGCADKPVGTVGVILPDTKTSARWATADLQYLRSAFGSAGVHADIQNAQGDKAQFQTIADGMISSGVKVLVIVNLDAGTGRAVLAKARAAGVATVDYDRLTPGGGADYHVSFDNMLVGVLQGRGMADCLAARHANRPMVAQLNGPPTDNNATLFTRGSDTVLAPLYARGTLVEGPEQDVPGWDNTEAGTLFEQMLTAQPGINGVLAANDGLAGAAIGVLRRNGLNGRVPVVGQDATVPGLQNILVGDQCMTVYKDVREEAAAAAGIAIELAKGGTPATATTVRDPESGREVPAVLLTPVAITRPAVKDVIADGYVTRAQVCTAEFAAACAAAGIP